MPAPAPTGAPAQLFYIATPVQLKAPTVAGAFKPTRPDATATTITPGATIRPTRFPSTAIRRATLLGGGGSGMIIASAQISEGR